ncbi:MAG: sorbosone dehydrogenase family protein, partial [Luteimonas sp.]
MGRSLLLAIGFSASMLGCSGCGDTARLAVRQGMGPQPALPEPRKSLLPTVDIAPAEGWAAGTTP